MRMAQELLIFGEPLQGFPYIFKGALDAKATHITMKMKLAASDALAKLTRDNNAEQK